VYINAVSQNEWYPFIPKEGKGMKKERICTPVAILGTYFIYTISLVELFKLQYKIFLFTTGLGNVLDKLRFNKLFIDLFVHTE
jgi:hypothetical protein